MYYVILGIDKPGTGQERLDTIGAFQAWIDDHPEHPDVTVHHGGPTFEDDGETMNGTVNVIEAPSLEAARAFAEDSPYRKAGIYAEFHVRPWSWRTGRPG